MIGPGLPSSIPLWFLGQVFGFVHFAAHQDLGLRSYSQSVFRALSRVTLCCAGAVHISTFAVGNVCPQGFVVPGNGVLFIRTSFGRNRVFSCTVVKQKANIRNLVKNFPPFIGKKIPKPAELLWLTLNSSETPRANQLGDASRQPSLLDHSHIANLVVLILLGLLARIDV